MGFVRETRGFVSETRGNVRGIVRSGKSYPQARTSSFRLNFQLQAGQERQKAENFLCKCEKNQRLEMPETCPNVR